MAKTVIQKNWYEIQAPEIFSKEIIAETPADNDTKVIGRKASESLTDIMDESSKYYVDVTFRITEVEGNKAFAEIYGMECSSEFVSRMIRKRSDRMDLVTDLTTSDDREVRIKVIGATVGTTSTKTLTRVRNQLEEVLEEEVSNRDYQEVMKRIFTDELQKDLRDKADKITPFRELEVRKTELLD